MTEIDLQVKDVGSTEYFTESVPRKGEYISVDHDGIIGTFIVYNVVHRVFQSKGDTLSYVTIYAEEVSE
jgi:hypothetical protein